MLTCFVLLCVLRLTNFEFVHCLHLSSLWNFARVCFYVLRTSPRKNRVCAVVFPQPLLSLYAYACYVMLCLLRLTGKHRVCAVLAPRFPLEFCTRVFLCFAYFASQTPGLCSAFPSAPFEFVRLCHRITFFLWQRL